MLDNDSFASIVRNKLFEYMEKELKGDESLITPRGMQKFASVFMQFYNYINPYYKKIIESDIETIEKEINEKFSEFEQEREEIKNNTQNYIQE